MSMAEREVPLMAIKGLSLVLRGLLMRMGSIVEMMEV